MLETEPHPLVNLKGNLAMLRIIVALVTLLSLKEASANFMEEFVVILDEGVNCLYFGCTSFIRTKRWGFSSIHNFEWRVTEGCMV
jgi:hypothetical protein